MNLMSCFISEKVVLIPMRGFWTHTSSNNLIQCIQISNIQKNGPNYPGLPCGLQSNREMASKWVKMRFLELGVNRKVVGNVENYLNMEFQPNIFTRSREKAKKPDFLKIAYKKNLRFFGGNRLPTFFFIYNELTSCAKAKKSLEKNSRTYRTNGLTNNFDLELN